MVNNPISGITVVLPAYNEEDNIAKTVENATSFFNERNIPRHIIIVDDGSTDRTAQVADGLKVLSPETITVVHHSQNMGYGATIRSGFEQAVTQPFDWVFFTDSDGQFDIRELDKFFRFLRKKPVNMVIGYRIARADPFHRRLFAKGWTTVCRISLGFSARDVDCAFKLIEKQVLTNISLRGDGAAINPELLAKAGRAGYSFTQVGVHHYPRTAGQQSGSNLKVIKKSFTSLGKVWLEMHRPTETVTGAKPVVVSSSYSIDNKE